MAERLAGQLPPVLRNRLPRRLTRRPWPVRVDAFLEPGVPEVDVDRWVQSASILHSNGDALDIAVKDGRIVGVRGRPMDRVNHGRIDPKDLFGWEANASPDRLTSPRPRGPPPRRERLGRGDGTHRGPVTGAARWPRPWGHFGFYTSGQLFLEKYYTLA
jgi:ferredoxin-nitrate reductase